MSAARRLEPYVLAATYCAVPFVTLAADNAQLISLVDLLPYYLVCTALTAGVVVLARIRAGPRAERTAGVCAAIGVVVIFDYVDVRPVLSWMAHEARPSMVFLWTVVVGVIVFAAARLTRRIPQLPGIVLIAGIALLIFPLVRYADARKTLAERSPRPIPLAPMTAHMARHPAPDVYFFLLDAYSRPDRMRQQFGFDDGAFVSALRKRQFVVPPHTRAVYPMTSLSVPSILNMDYEVNQQQSPEVMAGQNPVVDTFRHLGYRFILAPINLEGFDCRGYEDRCINPVKTYAKRIGMSDLTWTVLQRSPGIDLIQTVYPPQVSNFGQKRQFPGRVARLVMPELGRRPVFVYAHSLLTHTPYPYQGPDCRLQHGEPDGAADYTGAVECANASMLTAVRVIERKDPKAVIVISSDHGTDVGNAGSTVVRGTLGAKRRYSNFVALRLPRDCRRDVPPDLVTVNIFRVVMNCLTTARMPMLRYRY